MLKMHELHFDDHSSLYSRFCRELHFDLRVNPLFIIFVFTNPDV